MDTAEHYKQHLQLAGYTAEIVGIRILNGQLENLVVGDKGNQTVRRWVPVYD